MLLLCRSFVARAETRVKEFIFVARVIQVPAAKARTAQRLRAVRQSGLKEPTVTRIRPEASRSSPEQGEVWRKPDGGPVEMLRFKSLT